MSTSASELAAIARRYYPPHLGRDDPRYRESAEAHRLAEAGERAQGERSRLARIVDALHARHPERYVADETVLPLDPCLTLRTTTHPHDPGGERWMFVVACVSVIAPVYMAYVSETWTVGKGVDSRVGYVPTHETAPAFDELCDEIEREFDVERVTPEVGLVLVPEIQVGNVALGEVTIYDAIFTPDRR